MGWVIAVRTGEFTAALATDDNITRFRTASGIRMHAGITPGDLGGIPFGDLLLKIALSDRLLRKAAHHFKTRDPWETCGFLIWSFNRLLNSVREDYPGATIGVASGHEGDFLPVYGPNPDSKDQEWIYYYLTASESPH